MTLQLLVNGVDFTSAWRPYESRWSTRAWQGESVQSEFIIDDPTGAFTHDNFRARKIVEVWENASGSPKCMYRGRIANKTLGPGMFWAPGHAMRWTLLTEDFNIDLRGIRVINATRPEETNYVRAEAIRLAYLNGAASTHASARDSTDLDGLYIGPTPADAWTLAAETYTDLDPAGVLQQMTEMDGHIFFVYLQNDGVGALAYMGITDEEILSNITIVDDAFDEGADGVNTFAAYHLDQAGDHGGQNVLSGAAIRYGDEGNYFEESDVGGREATYDKWEITVTNDLVTTEASADLYVNTVIAANEEVNTYFATIDVRAQDVHRIKAGMMVPLIRKRANKLGNATARAVNVTYEPATLENGSQPIYRVSLELGRPRFLRTIPPHRRRIPRPPTQPTEGGCTRFYFSGTDSDISSAPADSAGWDDSFAGSLDTLTESPSDSYSASHQIVSNSTGYGGSGDDILHWKGAIEMDADLAAVLAAGGATVRGQLRARSRFGIGISEASQDVIGQMSVRVTTGDSATIRGTALAMHSLSSSSGSAIFPAQSTKVNRVFPPTAADDTLSAVSGAAAGDYLVVEIGVRNFTTSPTGANIAFTGQAALSDLPEDELETEALNSWLEICTSSGGGASTQPGQLPGEGGIGTDVGCYALCDHSHDHGFLADDGTHLHDADQIAGLTEPLIEGFVKTTDGGQHQLNTIVDTDGSQTLDLADGNVVDLTLTQNITLAFTGATSGVECRFRLIGHWATFTPTFPGTVIWPDDTEPTWSTDADAVDIIEFLTVDGGTTWYGDAGGGSSVTLSDDTPLIEAGAGDPGVSTEVSRSDHVHPATSSGTPPAILLESGHATPFTFDDILQASDGSDFLWASS